MYWGPSLRDYGPPGFLKQAFDRLPNVECSRYECHGDPHLMGMADLHVCVDWGEDVGDYGAFLPLNPRVYWVSDTHVGPGARQYRLDKAGKFDRVYYNIMGDAKDIEGVFAAREPKFHSWMNAAWMPYAVEPQLWRPCPEIEKTFDVGFIGHYGNYQAREEFLCDMVDEFGEGCYIGDGLYFEDQVRKAASFKIVLNHGQSDSTNMRTFEAMSMGAVLLQPATSDLMALGFNDGVHLLTYSSTEEAVEKAHDYLSRPDDCAKIGEAARAIILDRHTYVHRAAVMAQMVDIHLTNEEIMAINEIPAKELWWSDGD